jgi:hypothetical protein
MSPEAARQRRNTSPIYLMQIELRDTDPMVYRRVLVPASIRLVQLSQTIEHAMGWTGHHSHELLIDGKRYGAIDSDNPDPDLHCHQELRLLSVLNGAESFEYVYDFAGRWQHTINLEQQGPPDQYLLHPLCIDGANACPPEDVGGSSGYTDFLTAMADPAHPQHEQMLNWYGSHFDALAFDVLAANGRLHAIEF